MGPETTPTGKTPPGVATAAKDLIPEVGYRARPSQTLQSILAAHGLEYDSVDDIPPKIAREIQRRPVFEEFRSIEMPAGEIKDSLDREILRDLLVTRIGYTANAAGHFIPRPEGSLDCVLHYCVDGRGWCEMMGRRWIVPADTVLLIPCNVPHCYGAMDNDPWSIYWIHFTGRAAIEYCRLLQVDAENPLFNLACSEEILSAFESIYASMNKIHTHNNLAAATGALSRFLTLANTRRLSANTRSRTAEENVRKTIAFMKENLSGHYSLKQLARIARMSPNHYSGVFRRCHDHPPLEYFNRLKIQRACRLLETTELQVQEIARELGFEDPYYFSRAFKKLIGCSPNAFRKK
ncbi:MAG: AraC family transcriptional regulator [Pirellulales bacterium]|nr:AraC family transcriptional regulator [Pirellulales bacterium]